MPAWAGPRGVIDLVRLVSDRRIEQLLVKAVLRF